MHGASSVGFVAPCAIPLQSSCALLPLRGVPEFRRSEARAMAGIERAARRSAPTGAMLPMGEIGLSGGGEEVADGLVGVRGGHVRDPFAPISSRYMLKMKSADCP